MLIAIIGDTHMPRGRRAIPDRCLELMRDADLILHTGDFVHDQVLEAIEALGPPVRAVHGNMDSPGLARRLPREAVIEVEDARIAMIHDGGPARGRLTRLRRSF